MRTLSKAPSAFVDPATGAPAFGSYEGPLPRVDLGGRALATRALRRKKWLYVGVASEELWISLAVVRMGYGASAFAFVLDLGSRRMLFDRALLAPPGTAEVTDDAGADGVLARFGFGRTRIAVERSGARCDLRARSPGLEFDLGWDESDAPPAVAAIAELGPTLASATEKRALARARGDVVVGGRRASLAGAFAGYDYTQGLMPRRTRWNWAFAMGRAKSGEPVGLNLVRGFVGEAECALFHDGRVHPIGEPRFDFDAAHPERPWRLEADGVDLTFEVGGVHAQRKNLGLVQTRFLQPAGVFRGSCRIDGRDVELDGVPGVVEDQDVRW